MVGPPAYHPFIRKLVIAKQMNVGDSAQLMALAAVGLNDALIAVFDAKYYYNFWRPITSIRRPPIVKRLGSRSTIRRCTRNTHAHTASLAAASRVS
jgi:hypothetical protein